MNRKRKSGNPVRKLAVGVMDLTGDDGSMRAGTSPEQTQAENHEDKQQRLEGDLSQLLSQAAFFIHLKCGDKYAVSGTCIGQFEISVSETERTLPLVNDFWMYISLTPDGAHFLYQEQRTMLKPTYLVKFSSPVVPCLLSRIGTGLASKTATALSNLEMVYSYSQDGRSLQIKMLVSDKLVLDLLSPKLRLHPKLLTCTQAALALAGVIKTPTLSEEEAEDLTPQVPELPARHHDLHSLFSAVKSKSYLTADAIPLLRTSQSDTASDPNSQLSESKGGAELVRKSLLEKLRPYQLDAVKWMIAKEKGEHNEAYREDIGGLFQTLHNTDLYMNSGSGLIVPHPPLLTLLPGGILADEMGLGKTVEVLTLMVCHPRPDVDWIPSPVDRQADKQQMVNITSDRPAVQQDNSLQQTETVHTKHSPHKTVALDVSRFECTCGENTAKKMRVQCTMCSLQQHAKCVGYDTKDPLRGDYKCPHCHAISEPISSGATLIIAPSTIRHQWKEEIMKHIGTSKLKVLEYEGVTSKSYIQPMTLAQQDIVITTYEVLRTELRATLVPHSNSEVGRQLRKPKRFMATPSPLTSVQWWRVCLDEAQMVESVTTSTAEMALKLSAVNRWCVTGTPINTGVNDLYGLLLFLGVNPFYHKLIWECFLYRPYCFGETHNLYILLRHVMWRTCKLDVMDQLGLPPQTEVIHEVMFSPVEEVFYRQQYSRCRDQCIKVMSRFTNKSARLDSLPKYRLSEVLSSLLSMRQACCHPEIARDKNTTRTGHTTKVTLTMDELLERMIKRVELNCEDSHRTIIAALNGQAACHIMRGEFIEAKDKYMEVLKPSTLYEGINTDDLQLIHANHNLRDLIELGVFAAHPTVAQDKDKLLQDEKELTDKYITRATSQASTAIQAYYKHQRVVRSKPIYNYEEKKRSPKFWWIEVLSGVYDVYKLDQNQFDMMDTVHRAVGALSGGRAYVSINTPDGLSYKLLSDWEKLLVKQKMSDKVMQDVYKKGTDQVFVDEVVNCCLRPDPRARLPDKKCLFCESEKVLKENEYCLFDFNERYFDLAGEEQRKGTWANSITENVFRSLHNYLKSELASRKKRTESEAKELTEEYEREARQAARLEQQERERQEGDERRRLAELEADNETECDIVIVDVKSEPVPHESTASISQSSTSDTSAHVEINTTVSLDASPRENPVESQLPLHEEMTEIPDSLTTSPEGQIVVMELSVAGIKPEPLNFNAVEISEAMSITNLDSSNIPNAGESVSDVNNPKPEDVELSVQLTSVPSFSSLEGDSGVSSMEKSYSNSPCVHLNNETTPVSNHELPQHDGTIDGKPSHDCTQVTVIEDSSVSSPLDDTDILCPTPGLPSSLVDDTETVQVSSSSPKSSVVQNINRAEVLTLDLVHDTAAAKSQASLLYSQVDGTDDDLAEADSSNADIEYKTEATSINDTVQDHDAGSIMTNMDSTVGQSDSVLETASRPTNSDNPPLAQEVHGSTSSSSTTKITDYLSLYPELQRRLESEVRDLWKFWERDNEVIKHYLSLADDHMKVLDEMKKHFKAMRVLWQRLRERVAVADELKMATIRFRVKQYWEEIPEGVHHIIEPHDVETLHDKQLNDKALGEANLSSSLRQLNYLKNIAAKPIDNILGNTEQCPICQSTLGHSWSVLKCCHSFCIDCLTVLSNRHSVMAFSMNPRRVIKCPVCREDTRRHDVSYVSSGRSGVAEEEEVIETKGNYSSKLTEVIRCLKRIERQEPGAKALVFSTWQSLLDVVAESLKENNITFRHLTKQKNAQNFRRNEGIEALLMPIASGANGLNLIEATHVLLLEPLLNPGKEAQAIGRIHRIGQTRQTYIHRFVVKHTIEEKIHRVMMSQIPGSADTTSDEMPLTLSDIADIFHV